MWAKPYFANVFCAGQTNTQRSESANHMLKNQIPPGAPMHVFVSRYMKLLAQHDEEEDFEERRAKLVSTTPRFNIPIEHHALKIYTPKVMDIVYEGIFKSGDYQEECLEPESKYVAVHINRENRAAWAHVTFSVTIHENDGLYKCDCGMKTHMGILCCHILKVMMHLGISIIPAAHVLKQWTQEAPDVLPPHLTYLQKDNPALGSQTFRHCSALIDALELVQMADCNTHRYEEFVRIVAEGKLRLSEIDGTKDGMTLEHATAGYTRKDGVAQGGASEGWSMGDSTAFGYSATNSDGEASSSMNFNELHKLKAPPRQRKRGFPSSRRDKPGYELNKLQRLRRDTTVNVLHNQPADASKTPKPKRPLRCSACKLVGSQSNTAKNKTLQTVAASLRHAL